MNTLLRMLPAAILLILNVGCATIVTGPSQKIDVVSVPAGAHVRCGTQTGKTPTAFKIRRMGPCTVVISKEGYQTQVIDLQQDLNPWVWGNLPLGGIFLSPLLIVVDMATGADSKWTPNRVEARLIAASDGAHSRPHGIIPLPKWAPNANHAPLPEDRCRITVIFSDHRAKVGFRIKDSGNTIGTLRRGEFITWERTPGYGAVQTDFKEGQVGNSPCDFRAKAGTHYFFEVKVAVWSGLKTELISKERAFQLLSECKQASESDYIIY